MEAQLTILLQQLVNALTLGSLYVLVALSVTIIFGLTGIVNFAVGQLMMLSSYLTLVFVTLQIPFAISVVLAVVILAVVGIGLERGVFRWTLPQPVNGFILSLGLILILQALVIQGFGAGDRSIPQSLPFAVHVLGTSMGAQNLVVLGVAIAVMIVFLLWLYRSRDGRALRAASEDRRTAGLMGIPATRLTALAFAVGVGLAAVAGGLTASLSVINPFIGSDYLLKGFVIATVGGLGNLTGAFVAGMLVALIEALSAQYLPVQWTNLYVFAAMVVILLIRPGGLFGVQRG
jgi:branched-chain amino acid transport system permease protein